MADSYYPEDSKDESESMSEGADEKPAYESFLTGKSVLGGKEAKPGDEWVFKVVAVHDDEIEWTYATGEEKDEKKKSAMDESMSDMGKMAGMSEEGGGGY